MPEIRLIETLLGTLHLEISGSRAAKAPWMFCWPSLLMDGRMWEAQAAHFGRRFRVVCLDPPGQGRSTPLTRGFTLEECAVVLRQLLDALGVRDCVLLGNSWGGMMGGVFAALYPERLRAAVLMNCTASAVGPAQQLEYLVLCTLLRYSPRIPDALLGRALRAFAGETTEREKPAVIQQIRDTVARVDPQSAHWAVRSVVPQRRDHHALLGTVRSPILVLTGEEDRTFPVAETRAMAAAIPDSRFVVLPAVGHLAALEAPTAVNREIDAFLAGVSA